MLTTQRMGGTTLIDVTEDARKENLQVPVFITEKVKKDIFDVGLGDTLLSHLYDRLQTVPEIQNSMFLQVRFINTDFQPAIAHPAFWQGSAVIVIRSAHEPSLF